MEVLPTIQGKEMTDMEKYRETFDNYKSRKAKIALQLEYGNDIIAKIKSAKTRNEVELIMTTARKNS